MNVINNLVVLEVPKGAVRHRILGSTVMWDSNTHNIQPSHEELPAGKWEIIGTYDNVNHLQMKEVYNAGGRGWSGSIWDWLDMPSDNNSLLFLKRIS